RLSVLCFFLHVPAPTAFYTLSLHDALPICFSVCLHQKMFWFLPSHWSRRYRVVRCMWICQSSCDIHSWPAGWHPRSGSRSPVALVCSGRKRCWHRSCHDDLPLIL